MHYFSRFFIVVPLVAASASVSESNHKGTDAFSQFCLHSNDHDIGPRYAGVLLGLSNTAGVLAGVFGTASTGYILQHGQILTLSDP